jgi:hypothetical protein
MKDSVAENAIGYFSGNVEQFHALHAATLFVGVFDKTREN